ncbi:unnamed protein product, partial [Ectocarpus fasciculatus]
ARNPRRQHHRRAPDASEGLDTLHLLHRGNELPAANSRAHRTRSHGAQRSRTDPSLDGKGTKQASVQGNTTGWRALPAALAWVSQTALVFSNNTRFCCSSIKETTVRT